MLSIELERFLGTSLGKAWISGAAELLTQSGGQAPILGAVAASARTPWPVLGLRLNGLAVGKARDCIHRRDEQQQQGVHQ